jgi:hypothetical protein
MENGMIWKHDGDFLLARIIYYTLGQPKSSTNKRTDAPLCRPRGSRHLHFFFLLVLLIWNRLTFYFYFYFLSGLCGKHVPVCLIHHENVLYLHTATMEGRILGMCR